MRAITHCSNCIEKLDEDEASYFTLAVHEMPLCTQCILTDWELI